MGKDKKRRRVRWVSIDDFDAAVTRVLDAVEEPEPVDEDRNAAEAVEDARRERD